MNEEAFKSMLLDLVKWHQSRVENCKLITEKTEAALVIKTEDGREFTVEPGTKEARCIQLGVMLALEQFTPFPVTLTPASDEDHEEDYEDE